MPVFSHTALTIVTVLLLGWACNSGVSTESSAVAPSQASDAATESVVQEGTPSVISQSFTRQYPGATVEKWNRDRNDSYEAHFKQDGFDLRADFTPAGVWIETERSVKWKDLPPAVQAAIEQEYDKDDIVELEFTQNAERGDFYDVEIDPKGDKKFDVEYRADGSKV